MQRLRANRDDAAARAEFEQHKGDLGYALLLKKIMEDPSRATSADITKAADSTIPNVPVLFWSFRIMVGCGIYFILLFAYSFWLASVRELDKRRWYLKLALWSLPLPWLAIELGWVVAEYGRQPWTIAGVLPTHLSASSLSAGSLWFSLAGFLGFYTLLLVVEMGLMVKYARLGPASLHTGRYHGETPLSRADDHAAAA
jgi:cytochrome d ubiquinol oxidase subunit I